MLHLNCCIESFYIYIISKQNKFTILSQFPVKNPIVSISSLIMKNIVLFSVWPRSPVKLFCCVALGSALVFVIYLNLWQSTYYFIWSKDSIEERQLCNHLLELSQFFECYHIFFSLITFYRLIKKVFFPLIIIF